jgi:hypothetical protein
VIEDISFDLPDHATLRVPPGGRVNLGSPRRPDERHFFLSTGGSVNRDPDQPRLHYFRAGLTRGAQLVRVLRVGAGLVPAQQTIRISIE